MTTVDPSTTTIQPPKPNYLADEAQLAAAAFLARYSGRTLDAYRHDLRGYFQWASDIDLGVLEATRPHVELYRSFLEERGLAASTMTGDCPRYVASTASLTSTAGSPPTRPSTSGVLRCARATLEVLTARSWACSSSPPSAMTVITPPLPYCWG